MTKRARTIAAWGKGSPKAVASAKSRPSASKGHKKPIPTESQEQAAVIQWWAAYSKTKGLDERLLFAIPNGANKSIASAMKFKREGLRAGVPDLFLAVPSDDMHGLFIEMKRLYGKHTIAQQEVMNLLYDQGYAVAVCYGADVAIREIKTYLGH